MYLPRSFGLARLCPFAGSVPSGHSSLIVVRSAPHRSDSWPRSQTLVFLLRTRQKRKLPRYWTRARKRELRLPAQRRQRGRTRLRRIAVEEKAAEAALPREKLLPRGTQARGGRRPGARERRPERRCRQRRLQSQKRLRREKKR